MHEFYLYLIYQLHEVYCINYMLFHSDHRFLRENIEKAGIKVMFLKGRIMISFSYSGITLINFINELCNIKGVLGQ